MRTKRLHCILLALLVFAPWSSLLAQGAAETNSTLRIEFNVRVPLPGSGGVELSADVYRPAADGKYPVILFRTPYNKNSAGPLRVGRYFAGRDYVVVYMDVRGRGDSGGEFVPYRNDGRDGYDAIEWCASQPWSSGNVGTLGGSYLGRIQWLAALEQPPHLKAMIPLVTPSDPFVEWPTGQPLPMDISWHHYTSGHVSQNMDAVDWAQVHWHLPLLTMDKLIGRDLPHWRESVEHAQLEAFWEPLRYQNKFDQLAVPALHISGWYDDEQIGTPLNFIGMTTEAKTPEARRSQKLLMGMWPHATNSTTKLVDIEFGPDAKIDLDGYELRWFDYWLKGIDNGIMSEPPVRVFVMGDNLWRNENEWPLARTQWTKYYLHSSGKANSRLGDGMLSMTIPGKENPDVYQYDPANPTTFITDASFAQIGSADDYQEVEKRDDLLVYSTPELTADVEMTGPIKVHLFAASSAKDTDFMAMLLDVWPNGYVQRLCDGMIRARFRNGMDKPELIEPGKVYEYVIDCWNTSQVFKRGHRIRLQIASSAFPKYDRNLNTGEPMGKSTNMMVATQRIFHDRQHPSHALLPIIPR